MIDKDSENLARLRSELERQLIEIDTRVRQAVSHRLVTRGAENGREIASQPPSGITPALPPAKEFADNPKPTGFAALHFVITRYVLTLIGKLWKLLVSLKP